MADAFFFGKSLSEIEEAVAKLPAKGRHQFVQQDISTLCPDAFPTDGGYAILGDVTPRPTRSSLFDKPEGEYPQKPGDFLALNEKSLRGKK